MRLINGYYTTVAEREQNYVEIVNTITKFPGTKWVEKFPYSDIIMLEIDYSSKNNLYHMYLAYGSEGDYKRDNLMLILGAHFATLNSNELICEFRKS